MLIVRHDVQYICDGNYLQELIDNSDLLIPNQKLYAGLIDCMLFRPNVVDQSCGDEKFMYVLW